jgi:hypothetical protein
MGDLDVLRKIERDSDDQAALAWEPAAEKSPPMNKAEFLDAVQEDLNATMGDLNRPRGGEERITSETGGQKGRKPERMDLIPPECLEELSKVYGFGASKYDDHNYLKGYAWSLSYGAMLRHINAFADGFYTDDESGLPHLAHAAWHCFTLMMFDTHELGTDDRLFKALEDK